MIKEENLTILKMALGNHQPIEIYLDNKYYDKFYFDNEKEKYIGEFGQISLEDTYKAINGLIPFVEIRKGE